MAEPQRTIRNVVEFTGIGLHSGEETTLSLKPAGPDHGVVFVRTDLPGKPRIAARPGAINTRMRRTTVSNGGAEVQTVEHLLSCLAGLGIDNVEVEIDGPEVPGADGSALPFLELIAEAGSIEQDAPKREIRLTRPIHVDEDGVSLFAVPAANGLTISYTLEWWSNYGTIDYSCPVFAPQHFTLGLDAESYAREIAPARTFVASVEAEKLRSQGLGKGADYSNTLVVGPDGVLENELRFQDEFVRHKILDLIGDLALLGGQLHCHIIAIKSGHDLNRKLVELILEQVGTPGPDAAADEPAMEEPDPRAAESGNNGMDVRQISKILPHRYPFLLVDRVLEWEDGKRAVGLKNVTFNEPFFQGHFPGLPVMPGVLQIEAMAQVAGLMLTKRLADKNKLAMLLSLDKVKLRKAVVPGDQLIIEALAVRLKERSGEVRTTGRVDGKVVAEASIRFMIVDKDSL